MNFFERRFLLHAIPDLVSRAGHVGLQSVKCRELRFTDLVLH